MILGIYTFIQYEPGTELMSPLSQLFKAKDKPDIRLYGQDINVHVATGDIGLMTCNKKGVYNFEEPLLED